MADRRTRKRTLELEVVGLRYRVTPPTMETMSELVPIKAQLAREPENLNDENAIAVILTEKPWKDFQIGYLRRQTAKEIAPKIDKVTHEFSEATITSVDPKEATAEISVKVKSLQNRNI